MSKYESPKPIDVVDTLAETPSVVTTQEILPLRPFEQLNPKEKISAILGVAVDPIPKAAVLEWAGVNYAELSPADQAEIDGILSSAVASQSEDEPRYMLSPTAKKKLEKENIE